MNEESKKIVDEALQFKKICDCWSYLPLWCAFNIDLKALRCQRNRTFLGIGDDITLKNYGFTEIIDKTKKEQ